MAIACGANDAALERGSDDGDSGGPIAGGLDGGGSGTGSDLGSGSGGSAALGGDDAGEGIGGVGGASELELLVPPPPKTPAAGKLTAGIFDDNISFDFFESYWSRSLDAVSAPLPIEWSEFEAAHAAYAGAQVARTKLDIALLIDTTGSMGDELDFLKTEFSSITDRIASKYPNADQRWALVVYRDEGDEYVTRTFDFDGDLQAFDSSLSDQTFDGGGDTPEAPEAGIEEVNGLSWRPESSVARLVFWAADAPHHDHDAQRMADAVRGSRDLGVHLYPIGASGVDALAELTMRAAAQLTLGRYLFLTDDSGLGGGHQEPTLPCYYVQLLEDAMLRAVDVEMTGTVAPPDEDSVIRWSGGITADGYCAYGNGNAAESRPF